MHTGDSNEAQSTLFREYLSIRACHFKVITGNGTTTPSTKGLKTTKLIQNIHSQKKPIRPGHQPKFEGSNIKHTEKKRQQQK